MKHKNLFLLAKLPTHLRAIIGWSGNASDGYIVNVSDVEIPAGTILLVPLCNLDVAAKLDDYEIIGESPGRIGGEPLFEAIDAASFIGFNKFPQAINAATLINRDQSFLQERYNLMSKSLDDSFRMRNEIILC